MLIRTIEGVTRTKGTQGIFGVVLEDFINENRWACSKIMKLFTLWHPMHTFA